MLDFIHPEDAAALDTLKKISVLPAVIKTFMDLGTDQLQTGPNMTSKVKLSPTIKEGRNSYKKANAEILLTGKEESLCPTCGAEVRHGHNISSGCVTALI